MGRKYAQLTLDERYKISRLQEEGKSIRQIAAALARSASTVSREIRRNRTKTKGYDPGYADVQTQGRRWQGSRLERQPTLRQSVLNRLAMGWSPQEVSGRLARERGCSVISHESIYRFIYAQIKRTKNYKWRNYLPRGKSKRGWRGRSGGSSVKYLKHRVSIDKRPESINARKEPGHWEADLMLFSQYGQAVLVLQERVSRLTLFFKIPNKKAETVVNKIRSLFECLPSSLTKSVTFDNGTEFAEHHQLHKQNIRTYFCDVRAPWQKGGVENSIGRLRRFLPRKTDLNKVSAEDIDFILQNFNHTPRKCLDFATPAEVFYKQVLHFKCETTFPPARE